VKPASVVMACLFVLCIAVQYNDPDPLVWMALYLAPLVASLRALWGRADFWPNLLAGAAYSLAALLWAPRYAPGYIDNEEAREAAGLLLSGLWMVLLAGQAWRRRRVAHGRVNVQP
jgi:Transmembrane family 220, helix